MLVGPLKLKIQLFCGEEPAIGPGKAMLLDAIETEGSISGAGRITGMSYRRTWLLVDSMNRCFAERLVDTSPGGGKGRGAHLTETGRAVLAAYRSLDARVAEAAKGDDLDLLLGLLRDTPLPPAS